MAHFTYTCEHAFSLHCYWHVPSDLELHAFQSGLGVPMCHVMH